MTNVPKKMKKKINAIEKLFKTLYPVQYASGEYTIDISLSNDKTHIIRLTSRCENRDIINIRYWISKEKKKGKL